MKRVASRKGFGDDRGPRTRKYVTQKKESFRATCSECGNGCTLPFKPFAGKPVKCSRCFGQSRKGSDRSYEKRPFHKGPHNDRAVTGNGKLEKQIQDLQRKVDQILEILSDLSEEGEEDGDFTFDK